MGVWSLSCLSLAIDMVEMLMLLSVKEVVWQGPVSLLDSLCVEKLGVDVEMNVVWYWCLCESLCILAVGYW